MTNQEFFDAAVAHLRKQNAKAVDDPVSGGCRYVTDGGLKCAVGGVMSEEVLGHVVSEGWVSLAVDTLIHNSKRVEEFFSGVTLELMRDVQKVHDCDNVNTWEGCLRAVAERHSLQYTEPTNAQ